MSEESGEPTTSPDDAQESVALSSTTDKMKLYKDHLRYNREWQERCGVGLTTVRKQVV